MKKFKICYFGIYNPEESRNRIYIRGFRNLGAEIIECRDTSKGLLKYFRLFFKHWKIRNNYDVLIVGYPGHVVVWLAKLISNKLIIFDALCTMEDGVIISRKLYNKFSPKYFYIKFVDWLAVKSANLVLVESEAQKKYFDSKFGMNNKYKVVYTGADGGYFFKDENIRKRDRFTVVFRGKFLPEAGVKYVIEAANILKNEDIYFLIIGNGFLEKEIKLQIEKLKLKTLELISRNLHSDEMRSLMLQCHISLGQFEDHERLSRTIPHKAFESLALGLTYITARAEAISEILNDKENVLFVNPADPKDLSEKILLLKDNLELREKIAKNGLELFRNKFTPKVLASEVLQLI